MITDIRHFSSLPSSDAVPLRGSKLRGASPRVGGKLRTSTLFNFSSKNFLGSDRHRLMAGTPSLFLVQVELQFVKVRAQSL
ncbi:hypothetical protein PQG02_32045 (plasmid) [Nostoc sp. UHCC 0926]|uniref:hypothetical protein n=1 Tax=Nostoc sp. UHCC 0926 TaxID=3025190 RepID=UPI002362AEE6|nr:hypothetical protein [Nostoc sp. UHCC 0926]WDD36035.1 hypothetical protein PQG02_32045 [Nostoc sp. UHCC 0926]